MILSDISVRRPVLATVMSLIVIVLGVIGFSRLGVREFPDIDPPTVSIGTVYPGAAATVAVAAAPARSTPARPPTKIPNQNPCRVLRRVSFVSVLTVASFFGFDVRSGIRFRT